MIQGWTLFAASVLWLLAGALVLALRGSPGVRVAATTNVLGGIACTVGGLAAVVNGTTVMRTVAQSTAGALTLRVTPLAGVFLVLLGLVSVALALYAPRYHAHDTHARTFLCCFDIALVSSLGLLVAGNVVVFLISWETMALFSYLLVMRWHRRNETVGAGFWFLALSEVGFVLIIAAFLLLATGTHSMDFATMASRAGHLSLPVRGSAYVLALCGFGFKAGVVPLHIWLPEAHPVAPADGSAYLSGLVVKLGIYGIVLFAFDLLGTGPAWWGLLTMALGAASAVIGILYAIMERDIKRFLAYSTIENVGVVLIAVGAAMTFEAYGDVALGGLLLLAGLYHAANHCAYKTLLFMEAGVVEHATGTRDMDRLGGLARRLPRSGVVALVGTLGIAALPPLNGFVSEWLIFQGLFQGFRIPSHLVGILIVTAAACLGLTGGLAIHAFVRAYGIPYLGMPRTAGAATATEREQPISGPTLLAAVCVLLGVGAPLVVIALSRVTRWATGVDILHKVLVHNLTILPAHTDFSAFSPTYLTVFLVAALLVPLAVYASGRTAPPHRIESVWDGGIVAFKPRLQYSAMTFAAPVRVTFTRLYRPVVSLRRASDEPAGASGPVHYETTVAPLFRRWLYDPVIQTVRAIADFVRPVQSGDVNLYLLYVFVAILVAYLIAAL